MSSSEPTGLARLSMSLPANLFRQLDMMVEERGLPSRSQLIAACAPDDPKIASAQSPARADPRDASNLRRGARAGLPW